ncbi:MAG: 2-C-methyl-D-erythritol 4-phosphate cytidylyltransferase [Deltaproteobacteria bacterium]|nr:2-C-methyl-D-erythritol 4-phosphate cytidylyltransferase [Deltaproteobacteria bacterium]
MVSAIIVASGKGIRMKGTMRKQYLDLAGRPVLAHSIMAFDSCSLVEEIFLVVPKEDVEYCQNKILSLLHLKNRINLVYGGAKRQDSVYNGLQAIDKNTGTVVVHDGVRPFIHPEDLKQCILGSKKYGACILGIMASDTLKRVDNLGIIETTLPRENIWLAQTPQAFQYDLILKAHETARRDGYVGTDDASLVERLGANVKIINGSRFNIKITLREDLAVAKEMLDAGLI